MPIRKGHQDFQYEETLYFIFGRSRTTWAKFFLLTHMYMHTKDPIQKIIFCPLRIQIMLGCVWKRYKQLKLGFVSPWSHQEKLAFEDEKGAGQEDKKGLGLPGKEKL